MNWWQINEEERSPKQKEECRLDYLSTFLMSIRGRHILADMRRRVIERKNMALTATEYAMAVNVLDQFMRETRSLCGPVDEIEVIRAECRTAAMNMIEETRPDVPDGIDPEEFLNQESRKE